MPREVWWIAGLSLLGFALALYLGGGERDPEQEFHPRPTTYSSGPDGLRALYLTLEELGYEVHRLRDPFSAATLAGPGRLLVVEPSVPLSHREWGALRRWVSDGNRAVLVGTPALPDILQRLTPERPADIAPIQPTYLARGVRRLAVRSEARIASPRSWKEKPGEETEGPLSCSVEWGTDEIAGGMVERAAPVFGDKSGGVVAHARLDRGEAVFLTDPWVLSNEGIARADNLTFLLNALGPADGGSVWFDEYHHGYGRNTLWKLMPLAVKLGLGQVLLGLLLVIYARSRRFGRPLPLDRGLRERSEFLGTMTTLLSRGGACRLALRTARESSLERLRAQLGTPPEEGEAAVIQAASRLNAEAGEKLASALAECGRALDRPQGLKEKRAATLVRRLDEAVESVWRS